MPTRDEYMQALTAADKAGAVDDARELARRIEAMDSESASRNENYSNEGRSRPSPVNEHAAGGVAERYAAGFAGAANRFRVGVNDAIDRANAALPSYLYGKDPLSPPQRAEANQQRQAWRNQAEHYAATRDQLGVAGAAGDITPELLATAVPIAKGGTLLARGVPMLGRLAPAAGDVAANALYAGGRRAATNYAEGAPDITEGVMSDAGIGGLYAAGGRAALRGADIAARGVKPFMSQNARELVERGVTPTPGQLFDGPVGNLIARAEDKATSLPLAGDIMNYARRRSLGDFNRVSINDALQPLGKDGVIKSGAGVEAVEAASRKVSDTFERGLDGMVVTPQHITAALQDAGALMPHIPLFDEQQATKIAGYVQQRIAPLLKNGVDGQAAKRLDSELGYLARKYSRSPNPGDHPMGEAFDVLQHYWRGAMVKGASGNNYELVKAANAAYRNMIPVVKAADKAMAQGGVFTPNQLARSRVVTRQGPSSFDRAAQDVLPSRVPDSGSAGRLLTGGLIGGGGVTAAPTTTAITAALTGLAYSRAGIYTLVNGLGGAVPPKARERLLAMAPEKAAKLLEGVATTDPAFARQLAAQLGRMQPQQEEPQP